MTPHRLSCRVYRPESLPRLVLVLAASIAVFLLLATQMVVAQSCGTITAPPFNGVWYDESKPTVSMPITNCADPFNVTTDPPNPYQIVVNGQMVPDGGTIAVPNGKTTNVIPAGRPHQAYYDLNIFKRVGDDYVYIPRQENDIETEDYEQFAASYFTDPEKREFYLEIFYIDIYDRSVYFYDEEYNVILDSEGNSIVEQFDAFIAAAENNFAPEQMVYTVGTYTFVMIESTPTLNKDTTQERSWLAELLIPSAHAQYITPTYIYTRTITIIEEEPEPVGASSILFLPGIMGSHLYEMGQQCGDFGDEQQRWFSIDECEQLRLLLNDSGDSQHDVYTKVGEEGIFAAVDLGAIEFASNYAGFMEAMEDLEGEIINEFVPFPYDWRLRLDHLLQLQANDEGEVRYVPDVPYTEGFLYTTIKEMADDSYSKKVTIVAHSNGGLVAKAFLEKLAAENDPLASKIDNLILVGSPQVGTPDAIVGLLHGTDLAGGWVVEAEVSRQILNNAPMTYHLLPNEHYFAGDGISVDTPVILFDRGTATDPYIAQFGSEIKNVSDFEKFAGGVSGRATPDVADLYTPAVANDTLLDYADVMGDVLVGWTPPETINVYQLAGVGMWTPKTLRYFSGEECINRGFLGFGCDAYAPKLLHETYFTREGDGTVVLPSALAMGEESNVTRWWLDLEKYNAINRSKNVHKDMMEIPDVATFVSTIAAGTELQPSSYIKDEAPDFIDEHTLVYRLHSPLDMYIESDDGVVSSTTNTIPGALYRRQGETQYIFIPPDTKGAVLHLVGYATGSFTLVVETLAGEEVIESLDYRAVPTGTSTRATLVVGGVDEIQVDFDGDGEVDGTVDAVTDIPERIGVPPPVVATSTVTTVPDNRTSGGTRVHDAAPVGQVAGVTIDGELARLAEIVRLLEEVVRLMVIMKQM